MNLIKKILVGAGILTTLGNFSATGQENYNVKYKVRPLQGDLCYKQLSVNKIS